MRGATSTEIRNAVAALHADPRDIDESFAALGLDGDEAAYVISSMLDAANATYESESGRALDFEDRTHVLKAALTTFLVGVSVGRTLAHEEDVQ